MTSKLSLKNCVISLLALTLWLSPIVAYFLWIANLEDNYLRYANNGEVRKNLDEMSEETDANLVWMMRSKEYREASNDGRIGMRRSWAFQYTDRAIGRFFRLMIGMPIIVVPFIAVAMLLSSIAGCD